MKGFCEFSGFRFKVSAKMNTEGLQKRNRDTADIIHDNDPTQQKYVAKAYRKSAEVVKKPGVPSLIVAVALPLVAGMIAWLLFAFFSIWL